MAVLFATLVILSIAHVTNALTIVLPVLITRVALLVIPKAIREPWLQLLEDASLLKDTMSP